MAPSRMRKLNDFRAAAGDRIKYKGAGAGTQQSREHATLVLQTMLGSVSSFYAEHTGLSEQELLRRFGALLHSVSSLIIEFNPASAENLWQWDLEKSVVTGTGSIVTSWIAYTRVVSRTDFNDHYQIATVLTGLARCTRRHGWTLQQVANAYTFPAHTIAAA